MDKIFVWSGKIRSSQYWEFQTLSLKLEELEKYVSEKGYVSIIVNKRKTPDNYWNDLTVAINDYKPKEEIKTPPKKEEEISIEDIPF